jgi:GNAT superfamily N-acetyltransferase
MEKLRLERAENTHPDFVKLVGLLDAELAERDGEDHAFYNQYNGMDGLDFCMLVYSGETAVGCGAMKRFSADHLEIKRMYTLGEWRGKGIAGKVLRGLEDWAREIKVKACVLETGKRQPEAIALYESKNYQRIANFGPYIGIENSVCFEKLLDK